MLGAGDMGGGGGDNTTWIVLAVVSVAIVALLLRHRSTASKARARVSATTRPDAGVVELHDLPAPGSRSTVAIGVRVSHDAGDVQLIGAP